jgi:hypothetical protein
LHRACVLNEPETTMLRRVVALNHSERVAYALEHRLIMHWGRRSEGGSLYNQLRGSGDTQLRPAASPGSLVVFVRLINRVVQELPATGFSRSTTRRPSFMSGLPRSARATNGLPTSIGI